MKTPSMNLFDYLFLGSMIVEVFTIIAGWDWIVASIHQEVNLAGGGGDMQLFFSGLAPWLVAASFAASLLLWAFIGVFRWGFFRYIFAICVGFEIISILQSFVEPLMTVWFLAAAILSTGMKMAAVYFVFQADAGAWLRREA